MNKPQAPNPKSQTPLVIGRWSFVIGHWSLVIVFLALLILLLPAIQPLLTTDLTCGYDNGFHLWRAVQVASCLRQGYLYPRWAPDMAHGYGFPLFIFHPPLTAYVAASLNLLGVSWPLAINATFVLGMLLAGAFAFIFARELFGPAAGLVAAVAYVFSPFQAYDVFNRGSLSESFAWVFPPLILWAVHRWSVRGERRFLPLAALSLAGFILTHNLFAFLFAPLLVVWVLADGYLARDWRVIGRGALAGLLGLGLCTFFWLPGLAERGWVQTDRLLGTWVFDYRNNFLDLRQLLALPRATDPRLVNDWPPKALGLLPALIALLPLARWSQLNRQTRWRVALLLASTAGFAFLTLPASRPLWDRLPLLPYIQFPWRFLGPAAFSAAVLAGIAVSNAKSQISNLKSQNLQTSILIILLVLGSLGWFYPGHCAPPADTSIAGMLAWERATDTLGTTAKGEYLPIWVHRMPQDPEMDAASGAGGAAYAAGGPIVRLPPESLPQGARVIRADYGPVDATIVVESPVPFRARYLAFYYPGWRVTIDGDPVSATPADPDGLLSFSVPAGTHTVRVRFGETPLRLAADAISVLSLAILIIQIANRKSQIANLKSPDLPFVICQLSFAITLVIIKFMVLDRVDTPLRRPNLVDGHLRGVDVSTEIAFGDEFILLGHDELPETVFSGERFEVETYWRALQPGGPNYGVTFNVVDAQGHRWNGSDIRPPRWHRTPPPVQEWLPDQYAIVALSIPLLPGTPPGRYTVEAVAFDHDTLAPLTAHDAGGRALGPALPLGQITVVPPRRPADTGALGIRHRTDTALGPITLLGADFDRDEAAPGDPILLTTFWRADERPTQDLTVHLALLAPDGSAAAGACPELVEGYDLPPTVEWHPTSAWQPGDVWRGQHILHLPAALDSGDYTWQLSMQPTRHTTHLPFTLHITAPDRTFIAPPVDVEIDTRLDNVATLVGANLEPEAASLKPGDPLTVTLIWRAEDTPATSYRVFLHLLGPDGALVAQSDGIPANWTRPTTGWLPGEYVADARVLALPADVPAGDYTLSAGLYVPGGERITASDGTDAVYLATIALQTAVQAP
jgi:hypothetical protein